MNTQLTYDYSFDCTNFTGTAGLASGFFAGVSYSFLAGADPKEALIAGAKSAAISGVSAALIGGMIAYSNDMNFWTGGENAQIYTSPINDNIGGEKGECAYRCLEEFSNSYGMNQYDYEYWFKQNGYKLGVKTGKLRALINKTEVFSSDIIKPDINTIAEALVDNKRVLMGFVTDKGEAHAVMVKKVKISPTGKYRIWFAETSSVRFAPYSSSNIFELRDAGFWTFYPR
jgi:hypothetical protein